MHMSGMPSTMQDNPLGVESDQSIVDFLRERKEGALDHGIREIIMDPGIGFGKTPELNMHIIDNSSEYSLGCPVLIGASRKRFLSLYYPDMEADDATVRVTMRAIGSGADIVRVHNVPAMVDAISKK